VARYVFALVALLFASLASRAHADESAARQHFKRGIEAYDRARYPEALSAFEAAYREKPSGTIKRNIALTLKRLDRSVEAAAAFDEALDEGAWDSATRNAIERELTELEKSVATVRVASFDGARSPVEAEVTFAPAPPRHDPRARVFRLLPGLYVLTARATGFPDPPEKKLALVAGAPVDVTFVFGEAKGTLTVRASRPDAVLQLDGAEVGRGAWSGPVIAGQHEVAASAPGFKTTKLDVNVGRGATVEAPITLVAATETPPPYVAPSAARPEKRARFTFVAGLALDSASYRLGVVTGEPAPYGTRRDGFVGLSLAARFGVFLAKTVGVDVQLEAGQSEKRYDGKESTVGHVSAIPMVRFVAPGAIRFVAATGFGAQWLSVRTPAARGDGYSGVWRLEGGVQIDVRPVFLEGALSLDVFGIGSVRADAPVDDRLLYASPASRGGIRLGVGVPFE